MRCGGQWSRYGASFPLSRDSAGGAGWGLLGWDFELRIDKEQPSPLPSPGVPGEGEGDPDIPGSSVTANAFRQLALSLPEAMEGSHMGHPDFRVRGKIFATLGP